MARFKASRFLRSPRAAKVVEQKAGAGEETGPKAEPPTDAPTAARGVEPMKTRPIVQPQESHVDTSRRVDPGQTMRRVDPSGPASVAPQQKVDSSATTMNDERGPAQTIDPGSLRAADGGDAEGGMSRSAGDYTADDFMSRSSAAGVGRFDESGEEESPTGSDAIPSENTVVSSLTADETTLVDPADMTNDGPEMPAGFDNTPGNMKTGNLRGLAGDADAYGSSSMADASGFAEEDPDASTAADQSQDDATSSASNTQSEDDYGQREYLKGNSDGVGQSLDIDNMSDQEVADAVATEADYEIGIRPGKDYLAGRDYDVDNMSDQEVVDALDREAAYEISGGKGGTATSPSYVDADSGGEGSAQVAADAQKLHVPTTPVRGNIDPTEFGNGAEDAADTSILNVSDPGVPDDSTTFGGGSMGTPPASAGVDFGPDHVDDNPVGGPSDDIGGIGIGHDDGTAGLDFGSDEAAMDPYAAGLTDDLSQLDDPSHMADTPDIGFADDPGDVVADNPDDMAGNDFDHVDRVDDIYE